MFDLLKSKTKTEQGAAEQTTALTPVAAPQNVIAEITTDAAKQVATSDATYQDKIETAIKIAATKEALSNNKVQKAIIENKERELKNKSTVDKINSETAINEQKSQRESSLYERYKYIYKLFGIDEKIPSFFCVVVLFLYFIFGTLYTILVGIPFMIVNLVIDSLSAMFSKINNLTKNVCGTLRYTAICVAALAVLAIIVGGVFWLIKLAGGL